LVKSYEGQMKEGVKWEIIGCKRSHISKAQELIKSYKGQINQGVT